MKFLGVVSSSFTSQPYILSLSPNTFFCFDTSTKGLFFNQNNNSAFKDTNFKNNIGSWVLVTFSNYISGSISNYFPNIVTMSSNGVDIKMESTYIMPTNGITITQVQLGFEVVAFLAEMRFYSKFIQGAYGWVLSTSTTRDNFKLLQINLNGGSTTCLSNTDLSGQTTSSLQNTCVGDYNVYLDSSLSCNDNTKYFNPTLSASPPCASCNSQCSTYCYSSSALSCTCDISTGLFWLSKDATTLTTYCNPIKNIDFSSYQTFTIPNVKKSSTLEYTLEFWVYIYSYIPSSIKFNTFNVWWSLHNRISLTNINNSLIARCFSLSDVSNPTRYSENISQTLNFYKWNLVRCGTDILNAKYFMNTVENPMQTTDLPDLSKVSTVPLQIGMPNTDTGNWGFLFLRMIKLWQSYNLKYIDTSYM